MHKKLKSNPKLKLMVIALASAFPFVPSVNAAVSCSSTYGVVSCTGTSTGGSSGGGILIAPTNYPMGDNDYASTTYVGSGNPSDTTLTNLIGTPGVGGISFKSITIGAPGNVATIGAAVDASTYVKTGLFNIDYNDPWRKASDATYTTAPRINFALPTTGTYLMNYEGVDLFQPGVVHNYGTISNNNTTAHMASPVSADSFFLVNGPRAYTEGGTDSLNMRNLSVFLNGSNTTLNNYGVITIGVNNSSISNSNPGTSISSTTLAAASASLEAGQIVTLNNSVYVVKTGGTKGTGISGGDILGGTDTVPAYYNQTMTTAGGGTAVYSYVGTTTDLANMYTGLALDTSNRGNGTTGNPGDNLVQTWGASKYYASGTIVVDGVSVFRVATAGLSVNSPSATGTNGQAMSKSSATSDTGTIKYTYLGTTASLVTSPSGALYHTAINNSFAESYNKDGTLASLTLGVTKPVVYTVLGTSGNAFIDNLHINNYNKMGSYLYATSNSFYGIDGTAVTISNAGAPSTIQLKENILNAYVYNGESAVIEAVTSNTIQGRSFDATNKLYRLALNDGYAINADNNTNYIKVENEGTIASYSNTADTGSVGTCSLSTLNSCRVSGSSTGGWDHLGTALYMNNARTDIVNDSTGKIYGDIRGGSATIAMTIQNAGGIYGNIYAVPATANAGSTATSYSSYTTNPANGTVTSNGASLNYIGSLATFSGAATPFTAGMTASAGQYISDNGFVYQVKTSGGIAGTGVLGSTLDHSAGSGPLDPVLGSTGEYIDIATPVSTTNAYTYRPVVTALSGTTASGGYLDGGLIVGAATTTHPFELSVAPKLDGVVLKPGTTYSYNYAANNITVSTDAKAPLANNVGGTATAMSSQISTNFKIVSTGLINWAWNGTPALSSQTLTNTNTVSGTVVDTSTLGLSSAGKSTLDTLLSYDNALGASLENLATKAEVVSAVEKIKPEANGAGHQASMNVTDKVFGLVGTRLDEIHLASIAGRSGVATGDQTQTADGTGVWMQAFGAKGSQDRRAGMDGYNTNAYGFAVGADQLIEDDTRVGLVGSYGQSAVNGLGDSTGSRTSIDSYQGTLYGSTLLRKLYVNATLGLGYHDYTTNRLLLDNSVKGSHDAWQYSAKLDVGYPINMRAATLVPVASLAYSHLSESGYTESGVGALAVDSRDTDSFRTGLGAKALFPLFENTVSAGLELRAIWNHEFGDSSIDTTARFVDGGSSFTSNGVSLERDSANLGGSLRLFGVMDGVKQTLNVNYDAEVKSQYINQTASLQARFDF